MSVTTGWSLLVNTFGKDCVVTTNIGARLSIPKILEKGGVVEKIESFGFKKEKSYKSHGREYTPIKLDHYTKGMKPVYDITDFFLCHHYHFTGIKQKVFI